MYEAVIFMTAFLFEHFLTNERNKKTQEIFGIIKLLEKFSANHKGAMK